MYARWLESRLPQKSANKQADDPRSPLPLDSGDLTKMWKFCPPIAILIIVSFLWRNRYFVFSPNATRPAIFVVSTSKITDFVQNADDGHTWRQYTCAVEKKKVSYVYSYQTSFARDCANVVVNTSRPFSLQEKHVKTPGRINDGEDTNFVFFPDSPMNLLSLCRKRCIGPTQRHTSR